MDTQEFIQGIKKDLLNKIGLKNNTSEPAQAPAAPATKDPFGLNEEDRKREQFRTTFFVAGVALFLGIMALNFFGERWMSDLKTESGFNYIALGASILTALIGVKIIMGILQAMISVANLNKDFREKISPHPLFKIIFWVMYLQITLLLFNLSLNFIREYKIDEKIHQLYLNGFEFDWSTEDGKQQIKLENGQLQIQHENGETTQFDLPKLKQ